MALLAVVHAAVALALLVSTAASQEVLYGARRRHALRMSARPRLQTGMALAANPIVAVPRLA